MTNKHQAKKIKVGRPQGSKRFEPEATQIFGQVVRQARQEAGVSQEALADLAGIDRSYIGRVERGETTPSLTLIIKIAKALKISSGELMMETERLLKEL